MPSPTYQEIPITFEKGLVLEAEESVLGEGMASALTNWTPEHTGGLRARNRWKAISETGLTDTTYNVRGFGSIGVSTAPVVIQTDYDNSNTTTKALSLSGVAAGAVIVLVARGSTNTCTTTPSGYTLRVSLGSDTFVVFTKVSSGGTENATISFTGVASTNDYGFMLEVHNIEPDIDTSHAPASGGTSTTVTLTTTTDLSFMILSRWSGSVLSGANTRPTMTTLVESNENATGTNPHSFGYVNSSTLGANNYTWTNADTGTITCYGVAFAAANRSSRSFYVVMANAITDAPLTVALPATFLVDVISASDTSSYATGSIAPTAISNVVFAVVVNRKATTPDTPTLSGTNAFSGTWTQITTKLTDGGTRRITAFWSIAQSATAGVVTAAFGGATQLGCHIALFDMSDTDIDTTAPIVQSATGSGTGTAVTTTALAAFAKATNIPAIFVVTAATAAGTMTANNADLTEVQEDAQAEGLAYGAFVGYSSANLTPDVTLSGSVEWAAISVELKTNYAATGYRIWQIAKDELGSGTWEEIDTVNDVTDTAALVSFAQGAGSLVYTSDQMSSPREIVLSTGVVSNITDMSGDAGRSVVYHKNRFFMTGSLVHPARVWFSDLADPNTWGANSYFDLNADDGQTAEDMTSVEGLLLVAKTGATYLVSGSGVESFFVNALSGGTAATGRSLAKTPYGTILGGTNELWSVQGGGIDPLSRPLGNGYLISGYVTTAYASDKAYILDSGTSTIYVQDLTTGSFSLESVTHTDTPHVLFAVGRTLLYGCDNATTYLGGYRTLADTRVGDEPATTTAYAASTPLTFLSGPQYKYTPRHLFLQVRRQGASPANLTVTVTTPGGSHAWTVSPTATVTRERLDIGFAAGAAWLQIDFAQTCRPGQNPDDIERVVLGVDVERIR